jgi:hypothetical protein
MLTTKLIMILISLIVVLLSLNHRSMQTVRLVLENSIKLKIPCQILAQGLALITTQRASPKKVVIRPKKHKLRKVNGLVKVMVIWMVADSLTNFTTKLLLQTRPPLNSNKFSPRVKSIWRTKKKLLEWSLKNTPVSMTSN